MSSRRPSGSAPGTSGSLYISTSRSAAVAAPLHSANSHSSRSGRERPGTASTVASFASASGSVTSSDMSGATYRQQQRSHQDSRGKAFEVLLASDETMVLSESVDISGEQASSLLGALPPLTTPSEDDSFAATSSHYYDKRRSLDNSSAPSSSFPTPTLDSTPRLPQRARVMATTLSSSPAPSSSSSAAAAPPRPPRAVERSPSVSTRNSMASAQYATPPSGRSSTDSRTADSPVVPLHPLAALSPPKQSQPLPPVASPSRAGSQDQLVTSSESHRTITKDVPPLPVSRPRSRTSGAGSRVTAAELYAQSHAHPLPFPRSTSRPPSTKGGHTSSSDGAPPLPNDVISLAQEVAMASPDLNADKGASTFFSQRIKKTSGFLKKLRGDKAGDKLAPPLPGGLSGSSAGGVGQGKLSRRPSQSSFTSEGGQSTRSVPNASSAASDYGAEFRASAAEEPVPSIPSKWSKSSRGKVRREAPGGLGKPSSSQGAKDRSSSAPMTLTSAGGKYSASVPTRSSSQGMADSPPSPRTGRSPTQTHIRKASATQGGSTSSGSDMRHTLRAWESEMDETLGQSAVDLSVKTRIAAPPKNWTPSPRLPDFDSLDRTQRSGSFMGDSEDGHQHNESVQGTFDSNVSALSTPSTPRAEQPQRSWSDSPHLHPGVPSFGRSTSAQGLGIGGNSSSDFSSLDSTRSSTGFRQRGVAAAGWQVEKSPPTEALRPPASSGAHSVPSTPIEARMGGHASRSENLSTRSDVSFETAVDPGSIFMRRADMQASAAAAIGVSSAGAASTLRGGSAPSPIGAATTDGGVDAPLKRLATSASGSSRDADDSLDPEKSIRLLPRRGSAEAPPTPTEATSPVQREHMGHSREISDLGPLPGAGGGGPALTAARRGSRASSVVSSAGGASKGRSAGSDVGSEAEDGQVAAEEKARELMEKCWSEDETLIKKEKIAETLGGLGRIKQTARTLYMAKFDFTGQRVDVAFRKLCDKLFLRAETQQVDRILYAFSERFWQCNPTSLYGSVDVVHSLVFSLLLLNTDLHVADIQDRMTRTQFVRNTLSAIIESRGVEGRISTSNISPDDSRSSFSVQMDSKDEGRTGSLGRRPSRSGSVSSTPGPANSSPNLASLPASESPVLASTRYPPSSTATAQQARAGKGSVGNAQASSGSLDGGSRAQTRAWEVDLEGLLKEIYAAIKADQVRLPTADTEGREGLSPILGSAQRRMMGKSANSLTVGSDRINMLKRGSIRGIQGLLGNTNLRSDDNLSLTPSSFGSRSFSESWQQQTPNSSILSAPTSQLAPPTLGFASTLSQSIIKEAHDEEVAPSIRSLNDEIDDDELALMGPPWAKEGVLTRKHYWEAPSKRARDKNWLEAFVVVQKGQLSMFKFGDTSSSSAAPASGSPAMGGGNWLTNATSLGDFSLAHTLANALPPPGYNRLRPHVFALTLSDGAVFFFQAGHEELVQEWVSTCNYWAARQSREPLAGGVSNMEYGWNRVLPASTYDNGSDDEILPDDVSIGVHSASATELSTALDASIYTPATPARKAAAADTRSIRSGRSGRSLRNRGTGGGSLFQSWNDAASLVAPPSGNGGGSIYNGHSPAASLRGMGGSSSALSIAGGSNVKERAVYINDWQAPAAPGGVSTLKEEEQLEACTRHIARIEAELLEHKELQAPMLRLYTAKGPNKVKAMANWTRKSAWLLGELTKFNVYADCLRSAAKLRAEKSAAKELASMIERADQEMGKSVPEEEGGPIKAN